MAEVGIWEGVFKRFKTCESCKSIRNEFFCNGWVYGAVIEDLAEHVWGMRGGISSECLLRLTPKAREVVLDMIQRVFDDLDEREVE